jgi:hypothetical protein
MSDAVRYAIALALMLGASWCLNVAAQLLTVASRIAKLQMPEPAAVLLPPHNDEPAAGDDEADYGRLRFTVNERSWSLH